MSDNNELISIIVPIYNVQKYLDRCMKTLLNQTYRNIEIILVDDESPDECPKMCEEYTKIDQRVKVIHKKNGGLGFARNSGLEIAQGKYIIFVDSDDYVTENMCHLLYEAAKKYEADVVYGGIFYADGEKIKESKVVTKERVWKGKQEVKDLLLDFIATEPIANLAEKFNYTVEEMKDVLKMQYDGYHFGSGLLGVYNPFSLLNAFDMNDIRDYWFASGTPTYLIKLLRHNHEQMDELTGRYYDPSMFVDYKADVEKPLPMIYQSRYLTIKEYDSRRNRYLLDFPNNEVKKGFLTMVAANYFKPQEFEVSNWIVDAVILLEEGETTAFCSALTSFLADIPYDSHGSIKTVEATEKHFQYTFYLILRLLGVYCQLHVEKTQSRGRVDCVLETKDYVYIFEFKLDGTAAEALQQIEDKGYATPYQTDTRKVTAIGVSFSSETMTVEEWEEKTCSPVEIK